MQKCEKNMASFTIIIQPVQRQTKAEATNNNSKEKK